MANEKWPKNGLENSQSQLDGLSTEQCGEMFGVLQDTPNKKEINPELFWNKEAILEDLKKNHVDVKEVKAWWYESKLVSIDFPAVWAFEWMKMNFLIPNIYWKEYVQQLVWNEKFKEYRVSVEDLSGMLHWLVTYMKSYWVELDWDTILKYSAEWSDKYYNDVLNCFIELILDPNVEHLLGLKWNNIFVYNKGKYILHASAHDAYYEESPLFNLPDSSLEENIVYPIEWSNYDEFTLHNWNGESQADEIMWKMEELKDADLVLVYRDNEKYRWMAPKLKQLVKYKYGWKVYCISIPKGTEEEQLTEQDKKVLTEVLTTCKCMTDHTVSEWTWVETKKIEDTLSDKEFSDKQNEFLDTVKNLESYYMDKWIDTVYILARYRNKGQWNYKLLLEHGWFCQKEDGTIYYVATPHDQDEIHYNDAKRFWKNLFPNMHVEIIEQEKLICWENYHFDYSKSEWALAIVDRHFQEACKDFETEGWSVLTFGWDCFWRGISAWDAWKFLAEKICEREIGKK